MFQCFALPGLLGSWLLDPGLRFAAPLGFDVTSLQDLGIAGEKADLASENQLN
jgi:hypothetical protein